MRLVQTLQGFECWSGDRSSPPSFEIDEEGDLLIGACDEASFGVVHTQEEVKELCVEVEQLSRDADGIILHELTLVSQVTLQCEGHSDAVSNDILAQPDLL